MSWAHPQALWLLALVPLAFWPLGPGRQRAGTRLSSLDWQRLSATGLTRWGPRILSGLRAAGLTLLILALARPQLANAESRTWSEGIAIQLVIDTSLSMGYTDYTLDDHSISRMDAARHAVRLFVRGDEKRGLPGRVNDLIGLVTFNRYPDVVCPLTRSHDVLLAALDELNLGPYTNIGDGLAWGLERLRKTTSTHKVVILLSDGKQNVPHALDPIEAARLAAQMGIRVYTIGAVGNRFGRKPTLRELFQREANGRLVTSQAADSVDEECLRKMAETTGGKYFRATETDKLLEVYREIDALEKSRFESIHTLVYDDRYFWFLIPGLVGLCVEQLLGATRFLVIP